MIPNMNLARSERAMLLILAGIQFCHVLDFMIMMPLGPFLIGALEISAHEFGLLVASYSFSAAVAGLLMAPVVDRFERKGFLLAIFLAFALATLMCAAAPNYSLLLIVRGLAGIFGGMMGAMVHTMVADAIPVLRENLAKHPNTRLVIVSLGYNDIIKGVDPRFVTSAFVELFREAQKAKVPVLLVGIPKLPYTKGNDKPTALFEELGANNHIIYEREAFAAVLREAENMESGNQFNADGYRVFAEELEARLRKEGFIRG